MAVVVVREERPGDQRLIAYLVRDPEHDPSPASLRAFLEEKLPGFMIPSSFVWLEALPLTPSGKVDRATLPAPGHERQDSNRVSVSPRSVLESRLVRIW